ncbi:MAG: FecR family protein [Bacteroidetes bacterium]|nr:FecR family protein [Bacteroidota bacterium]MBS1973491.1 FecR family protein [Bacteroidota bacterium]
MSQNDFDLLLEKFLKGTCTPEEAQLVLAWHKKLISESEVDITPPEKAAIEKKIWLQIKRNIELPEKATAPVFSLHLQSKLKYIAAAAILTIIIIIAFWDYNNRQIHILKTPEFSQANLPDGYQSVINTNHKPASITLSDGSIVELQQQSALYYPKLFKGKTRDVYLSGNGFFKVAHDTAHHFVVHTDEGLLAEVLGTSFYVTHDTRNKKVEVTVVTGKVSVYLKTDAIAKAGRAMNNIILKPNEKADLHLLNNELTTTLADNPMPVRNGTSAAKTEAASFLFEEARVSSVLEKISAVYGIDVQVEHNEIYNCHFTGDISQQSLYDKLDILCKSIQATYEIRGTAIYIKGSGCPVADHPQ